MVSELLSDGVRELFTPPQPNGHPSKGRGALGRGGVKKRQGWDEYQGQYIITYIFAFF